MGNGEITRRGLLKAAGAGGASLLLGRVLDVSGVWRPGPRTLIRPQLTASGDQVFSVRITRPDDMLVLDLTFTNLKVITDASGNSPRLVRFDDRNPAYISYELPAQAVAEEAFNANLTSAALDPIGAVGAVVAHPSRLVFRFPAQLKSLPYTMSGLLSWAAMAPSLVAGSGTPGPLETWIEAPVQLLMSPDPRATWTHAAAPVNHDGVTELWHTRLTPRLLSGQPDIRGGIVPIRFVGDNEAQEPTPLSQFSSRTIDYDRRNDIRYLSSNVTAVEARKFSMSALGATLDLHGSWPGATGRSLVDWVEKATLGREHYVRLVSRGFLFPFGHAAAYFEVSDRRFENGGTYLHKKEYIVVRQRSRTFPLTDAAAPFNNRQFPFAQVDILNNETPPLDPRASGVTVFVVRSNNANVTFSAVGTDRNGKRVTFVTPLVFVPDQTSPDDVANATRLYRDGNLGTVDMHGQGIGFAPAPEGTATFDTTRLVFNSVDRPGVAPRFFPTFDSADIRVKTLTGLGAKGSPDGTYTVTIASDYRDAGTSSGNPGKLILQFASPLNTEIPADQAGGLSAPALKATALGLVNGIFSGEVANLKSAHAFEPADFFPETNLAGVKIGLVVQSSNNLPTIRTVTKPPAGGDLADPDAYQAWTELSWQDDLNPGSVSPIQNIDTRFPGKVRLQAVSPISGRDVKRVVRGELTEFKFVIPPAPLPAMVEVQVRRARFIVENGGKPQVDFLIDKITFTGPLKFVQDITAFLPFPSGCFVDVTPSQITTGYSKSLPTIPIGPFLLQNIALTGAVVIPFDGSPMRLRFALSAREKPFAITFGPFGGAGFFALDVSGRGLELVEAALEIGAFLAFDIAGLISGSVTAAAGIYFKLSRQGADNVVEITGYLRVCGQVSVLKVVTVSLELYAGLSYISGGGRGVVVAKARISLSVHVVFFEVSVSAEYKRKFGDGSDPPFGAIVSSGDWNAYCGAFA